MIRLGRVSAIVAIALLGADTPVSGQQKNPIIRVTTKLGVEATINVGKISHPTDELISYLGSGWETAFLLLKTAPEVFYRIPVWQLKDARLVDGMHQVTLADGRALMGVLECVVEDASNGNRYDLRTATSVGLVEYTEGGYRRRLREEAAAEKGPAWRVSSDSIREDVSKIEFLIRYWSTEGYIRGGEDHTTYTGTFTLKVGSEELQANLDDFRALAFSSSGSRSSVTVTTANRTITKGDLTPTADQGRRANRWSLLVKLYKGDGLGLAIIHPNVTVERLDQ